MVPGREIPKVIIIDFDGTLCKNEFPDLGSPEPYVREALLKLKRLGYTIKIHSCRTATYWKDRDRWKHYHVILKFMEENQLPWDEIIMNTTMNKPVAKFYVDDRAIQYKGNWLDVVKQVVEREE